MKKLFLLFIIAFSVVSHAQKQTYYYKTGGEIQNITVNNERLLVYFDKTQIDINDIYTRYDILREIKLTEEKAESLAAFEINYNSDSSSVLKGLDYVWDVEPVIGLNAPVPVSNLFFVKLKDSADYHFLAEMAGIYNVTIGRKLGYTEWYTLETDKHSGGNALEMSNAFF